MRARCDHPERLAAWCDALDSGTYTRGVNYLVERDNDGVMSFCAEGVCADLVARSSDRLRLVFHGVTEDPHFEDPTSGVPFVSDALSEWLGVDNAAAPLDLSTCPEQVQARIVAVHPAAFTQHGATEPWRLNDLGVEWPAIADALRCHYSVDRHRVPGTAEHAAVVAAEAALEPEPVDLDAVSRPAVPSLSAFPASPGVTGPGTVRELSTASVR